MTQEFYEGIFCTLIVIAFFVFVFFILFGSEYKLTRKGFERELCSLLRKGWIVKRNSYDTLYVQAKDEFTERTVKEAIERQIELDKIKRLNLPIEKSEGKYITGSWNE